jgi:hypothetical protein
MSPHPGWLLPPLLALCAAAQAQNPFIEAARASAASSPPEPAAATMVVRTFIDGCVAHDGESMRTVDWAINQGFEPVEAHAGAGAALLSGRPGTVLVMPGSGGRVLLAIDLDKRCTVWAERSDGPAVRAEFARAVNALALRGTRVQPTLERSVERAGAWRMQLQMRLRRAGGTTDFDVGAVTTLGAQPAAQVLSVAPWSSRPDATSSDPQVLPAAR